MTTSNSKMNKFAALLIAAADLKFTFSNGSRAARDAHRFGSSVPLRKGEAVSLIRKKKLIFFFPTEGAVLEEDGVTEIRLDLEHLYARADRREVLSGWLDAVEDLFNIPLDRTCLDEISETWRPKVSDKHVEGFLSCGVLEASSAGDEGGGRES